jgi:hypothetical protein
MARFAPPKSGSRKPCLVLSCVVVLILVLILDLRFAPSSSSSLIRSNTLDAYLRTRTTPTITLTEVKKSKVGFSDPRLYHFYFTTSPGIGLTE